MVRAGWYGRSGARRQRWWCQPVGGERHRFTEVLPRIVDDRSAEHVWVECTTTLEPWEGQPAPRLYGFTAKQIARALVMVAAGASYRWTAALIRTQAGRERSTATGVGADGRVLAAPNAHGQLVADWVQVFAPIIWGAYAPTGWSGAVLLDEAQFWFSRSGAPRGVLAFVVLGAVGYTPGGAPFVAALEAVPRGTVVAWQGLLGSLQGAPELVVTDGGPARLAAAQAWEATADQQTPELRRCEWHLSRNLTQTLPEDVQRDRTDPVHQLIADAQRTLKGWRALHKEIKARAHDGGYLRATKTVQANDALIREQIASRHPDRPQTTGALEQFFHQLDTAIGDRASRMTNKTRADALLHLLAAHRNGWADEAAWAELIRTELLTRKGLAPEQRQHTDPADGPSLGQPLPAPLPIDI